MEVITILIIVVIVVLLVSQKFGSSLPIDASSQKVSGSTHVSTSEKPFSTTPEDIMIENRGPIVKDTGDFPIPQTTTQSKSLSPEYPTDLSLIVSESILPSPASFVEYRDVGITTSSEDHFPKYYRKDNLSENTIGTGESRFAEVDLQKPNLAWSDQNVSQYPKYYTSQVKDELTNVGLFFDQNNEYTDLTGPRSQASIDDICYMSRDGEKVCLENQHLHNVPPSLISDPQKCGFLNSIGLLEYSARVNSESEPVMNGGILYKGVSGSMKQNETYSRPMKPTAMQCQI